MRRIFLLLLLTLAAAAALAWQVRADAGYVLIQFHGTSIETTLWFALAVLGVALVVFYYLARLALIVADALTRLGVAGTPRPRRSARSGPQAKAAIAWAEGRWRDAARLLASAAHASDSPLLNHLLAARAAAAGGDSELARGLLVLAGEIPGAGAVVAIERARLDLAAGNAAAALAGLDAIAGAHCPATTDLLLDVLPACAEWQRLVQTLERARELGLRTPQSLDALERRAFDALLVRAGKEPASLHALWKSLPASARSVPVLVSRQALALQAAGAAGEAIRLLDAALDGQWDRELVRALGHVVGTDAVHRLTRLEKLLAKHPGDAELALSLGRVALAAGLWGKARDYLEASLALETRAETCAALAQACEKLGEPARGRSLREQALGLAIGKQAPGVS